MFDLTKEVKLSLKWKKVYIIARLSMYLLIVAGVLYFSYLVLFPEKSFSHSFVSSREKSTIYDITNLRGGFPVSGTAGPDDKITFFTYTPGRFSKIDLDVETEKIPAEKNKISVQKSYRAFFYPDGEPLGFKGGSLVKSGKDHFIVSQGKLRKFASPEAAKRMGFNLNAFLEASGEDLKYNEIGENTTSTVYPDDSVFKIDSEFYILKDKKLSKFVSPQAFISHYAADLAINKDESFLDNFEISDELTGFSDGTLISFEGSAFVVSGTNAFPIQDPTVFESLGFKWENVIPVGSEEIGIYTKEKTLNLNQPHPNGIIMADERAEKYFYIQDGRKREIGSRVIANSYNRGNFVGISVSGINADGACVSRRGFFSNYSASCQADIRNLANTPGITHKYELFFPSATIMKRIDITFKQSLNVENLRISLGEIKNKIIVRYYGKK